MDTTFIIKGIGFAALGIGLFVLVIYAVMRLWNWLVPSLFNGPKLRFVQALGLFLLARLLFGFGGFGHSRFNQGGPHGYGRYWHRSDWSRHHHVAPKAGKPEAHHLSGITHKPQRETALSN
ncbi:hypothetical protein [Spirosoma utsteinense]|uniref:Uncharacterized protein n=1 Tax=Spirosoma utsteinense TaxID=2585773 RepID=A0ABR6W1U8_9BACT|nr:hypothetical protein [Spirosoma utsteinense]MBC3784965.1 hypothetical protein [Spirosoma utsteinense]MBC3790427.1 hypothetical protein [Spirosoma utsteinense]